MQQKSFFVLNLRSYPLSPDVVDWAQTPANYNYASPSAAILVHPLAMKRRETLAREVFDTLPSKHAGSDPEAFWLRPACSQNRPVVAYTA